MPSIKLTINGLPEALRALNISEGEMKAKAGKAAALAVIEVAKPYPGQSHKRQPFTSAKQRRYFFAALKSGAITVPYRRTGALADAWDYSITGDGADVTNAHPHAAYTIAPGSKYHKGTWPSEEKIAKDATAAAGDAAEAAIVALVSGAP